MNKEAERRIVIDASVVIDMFSGRDQSRVGAAERFFRCFRDSNRHVRMFVPRLFLAEVAGVLARFVSRDIVREVLSRVENEVIIVGDELYFRDSVEIALETCSRGADSYYIGLARAIGAVLVTSDKRQAINAKRASLPAYYLPEELQDLIKYIECPGE